MPCFGREVMVRVALVRRSMSLHAGEESTEIRIFGDNLRWCRVKEYRHTRGFEFSGLDIHGMRASRGRSSASFVFR
jgi:hypothetical protein